MAVCPVCDASVPDAEVERHVNAHFDGEDDGGDSGTGTGGGGGHGGDADGDDFEFEITGDSGIPQPQAQDSCFVCGASIAGMSETQASAHVNACLDGGEGAPIPEPEDEEDLPSDLPSDDDPDDDLTRNAGSTSHNSRKAASSTARAFAFGGKLRPGQSREARGDAWWSGKGEVPQNVSLGLIPVLRDMLARNAQTGGTRAAVLARSGTHIKGVFGFDLAWGCGYRNALMAIAGLQALAVYSPSTFEKPSVRAIQAWIEDAWRAGFDAVGREQLRGKLVGTNKWIGTTDLYAMFSSLGIPCELYDFNKPADRDTDEPTHEILERWTRAYFDADEGDIVNESEGSDEGDGNAFAELMRPKVRIGTRLPFILQHAGHSRTVVGYELAGKTTHLLMFDPGKLVPKGVRDAGLAAIRGELPITSTSTIPSSTVREDDTAAAPSSDEEVGAGGWVRKKKKTKAASDPLLSSLGTFRANIKKHSQFQVLVFPGTASLPPAERATRKVVSSVDVQR